MSINNGRTLTDDEKQEFAYEVALGYFDDDELRRKFRLTPAAFAAYKVSDEIAHLALLKKREIDETDFALKLNARRAARLALEANITIMKDPEASAKTRMEAGRQIREMAEGVDRAALKDPEAGAAVIIRTNLSMEGQRGVYTITSKEIDEQLQENRALVEGRTAPTEPNQGLDPSIAALIGDL